MIKHTLDISQRPAHLKLRNKQLILCFEDNKERSFSCEDVGVVILQHPAISLSSAALNALLESGAVVIICGKNHLPTGMLLPTTTHTELVPRLMAQIKAGKPAHKRVWQAIVEAKITAQANQISDPYHTRLCHLAKNVKSGDPENMEAQAAKIYWSAYFPDRYKEGDKRDPTSESLFNSALNYGYAIMRAAVARSLVSAGLQPALGVHHHRRNNPYCLADDVMEPLRPLVDKTVRQIINLPIPDGGKLSADNRRQLLSLLTHDVTLGSSKGPLMASLPRYVSSVFRMLTRESNSLVVPKF